MSGPAMHGGDLKQENQMASDKPLGEQSVVELRQTLIELKTQMLELVRRSDLAILELLERTEQVDFYTGDLLKQRGDLN